jgi:uncharacterized protein (TIGR03083 family)
MIDGSGRLGEWTVRELAAHTNRAQITVVEYIDTPRPPEPAGSDYFSSDATAARARAAVADLGPDPLHAVTAASTTAIELLGRSAPATVVGSPMGTMSLAHYLPSRTAELVIHTLDLARAIDQDASAPASSVEEALVLVARRAARKTPEDVLFALTGRAPLPAGYSVFQPGRQHPTLHPQPDSNRCCRRERAVS